MVFLPSDRATGTWLLAIRHLPRLRKEQVLRGAHYANSPLLQPNLAGRVSSHLPSQCGDYLGSVLPPSILPSSPRVNPRLIGRTAPANVSFPHPLCCIGGKLVAKYGRYRPIHLAGYAIMVIGFGLFSLFSAKSSTAEWVIIQAIEAAGAGLIIPVLLPAVQAPLTDADTALSHLHLGLRP